MYEDSKETKPKKGWSDWLRTGEKSEKTRKMTRRKEKIKKRKKKIIRECRKRVRGQNRRQDQDINLGREKE